MLRCRCLCRRKLTMSQHRLARSNARDEPAGVTLNRNGRSPPKRCRTALPSAAGCASSHAFSVVPSSASRRAGPLGCVPILSTPDGAVSVHEGITSTQRQQARRARGVQPDAEHRLSVGAAAGR